MSLQLHFLASGVSLRYYSSSNMLLRMLSFRFSTDIASESSTSGGAMASLSSFTEEAKLL